MSKPPHDPARGAEPLDRLATEMFNTLGFVRWPDAYDPIDRFDDLTGDGLPQAIAEWKLIRLALEHMPDTVLQELMRMRIRSVT